MIRTTLGHELSALDTMKNLGLWMIKTTRVRLVRALNAMNNLGL